MGGSPGHAGISRRDCDTGASQFLLFDADELQLLSAFLGLSIIAPASADDESRGSDDDKDNAHSVQLGPRPYFLVDDMSPSKLKSELQSCANGPFKKTDFSIGHRGAALQFPEHTKQSYQAAARMGAGIVECDVTFTKDKELVCRHSQCDLHTTTNILATPLAAKCSVPFTPATAGTAANAKCCTTDITLAEF